MYPGDVLHIFCLFITPQKFKYAICVCPNTPLFFFINSKPRKRAPEAQLKIGNCELSFLKHDSYINTAQVYTFSEREIKSAQNMGKISDIIKAQIVKLVESSKYLSPNQINLIKKNFL